MDRKMRILFVDDQPEILSGLSRMLRGLRSEWSMEFVESGEEALAIMAEKPFDVIVSDMRMPGMDGSQLLAESMKRHPETVRIVLSGQADQESVMRSVETAHQYLSKPCDAKTLKATIARSCSLRRTLNQESLVRLVSKITTLPSLPQVYTKLLEELQSEDASVQSIAELISQDVSMTAKLMQMVNSSFFGLSRRVESPSHAAALLGLDILRPLVLSAGIFSQFSGNELSGFSVDSLVEHSLAVSRLAEAIAKSHSDNKELAEDAMLGGLLHDVGQLLLIENAKELYKETLELAQEKSIMLCEAEIECLGSSHADVGAYLLGLWGVSDTIIEAVAFHHHPEKCSTEGFSPLTAVYVANILINETQPPSDLTYCVNFDADYLERCGVTDQLPKWRDIAGNLLAEKV